jgi:hypothetical protein
MMRTLIASLVALWIASPVAAGSSRCADCHLANAGDIRLSAFARDHVDAWTHSPHARHDVGCERCHGGDATTFDPVRAHWGLRDASYPASPINRVNLPRTCGTCHTGPFVAFQRSRHYWLLITADKRGPTCSTCHDEVQATLFSPKSVSRQCDRCHGLGKTHPRPDYGPEAGMFLQDARQVLADLKQARELIDSVRDRSEKELLRARYQQAEVPYLEARDLAHLFVFEMSRERLAVAKERTGMLLRELGERFTLKSGSKGQTPALR